jgi:hypothetical protein
MKYIFSFLLLLTNIILGQTDRDNYLITIDKYSFRPFFIGYPSKMGPGEFTAVDDGDLNSYDVKFPRRSDTLLTYNQGGKPTKEVYFSEYYHIALFVDSIRPNYLDTLLKSSVSLSYKKQPRQIYSLTFQIIYKDGKRIHKTINSNNISDAATLLRKTPLYSYLLISKIQFFGDTQQKLYIDDIIGWKIKDD